MSANQILVVDDEVGIRELLFEILRDEGYGGWWDVPQPELDRDGKFRDRRREYLEKKKRQVIR